MRRIFYAAIALAFLAGMALLLLGPDERIPELRATDLALAQARWHERQIDTYTIEVRKEADRLAPETIVTRVEEGRPSSLTINGKPLPPKGSYDVEGLFAIASDELDLQRPGERREGQPRTLRLRALFHAELGVPLVIKRVAPDQKSFILKTARLEGPGGEALWPARR